MPRPARALAPTPPAERPRPRARAAGPRRSQQERSAATRMQLIEAAVACIAQHGLARSTLAAIGAEAGVTSGAVQHHFGSRDELLLTVVEEFGKSLAEGDDGPAAPGESIAARVHRLLERYWSLFSSPQFLAVMKIWLGSEPSAPVYREMLDKIRWFEIRFDRKWVELFADCPAPPEVIATARHVALGTMRGLAVGLSYTVDRRQAESEVALLEAMLVRTLTQA